MLYVGSAHDIYQPLDYDFDSMRQNDFVENLYKQKATYIRQTVDIHRANSTVKFYSKIQWEKKSNEYATTFF